MPTLEPCIMYFLLNACIAFLRVVYFFIKLLPAKRKVVFISRQSDKPSLDFMLLEAEIKRRDSSIETVFLAKRVEKTFIDNAANMPNVLRQMYHLATSRACIADGYNMAISVLRHKSELKVFQIWHALAAIKKFGYQTLNTEKKRKIARLMRMHKNYDYIISGSPAMTGFFAKAFNYPESSFAALGLPRIDYLLSREERRNAQKIYQKYPELRDKKKILYAPTFRENGNYKVNELIASADLNEFALIIKPHPGMRLGESIRERGAHDCEGFSSMQLLSVADIVITDYSAFSVEAAVLERPVYLYVYDYEEYKEYPGLNIDLYAELPGCVFADASELFSSIKCGEYNLEAIRRFKAKYVCNADGTATRDICDFVFEKGLE